MDNLDWILVSISICIAAVHAFFGVRYREYFEGSRETLDKSYWQMIVEFKKRNQKPAQFLILAIWLQAVVAIFLVIRRFI